MPTGDRSVQGKTVSRSPVILYLGRDDLAHKVTLAIAAIRYTYTLTPQQCDIVEYLAHRISLGKALAFAKRHAKHTERQP